MVWFDWPLVIMTMVFFVVSWLYGWGLYRYFGDDPERGKNGRWFMWDWASVCGIATTVSITYTAVWLFRKSTGYELTWQILEQSVFDLLVMFIAALPSMSVVRIRLIKDRRQWYAKLKELRKENAALRSELIRHEAKKNSLEAVVYTYEIGYKIPHNNVTGFNKN